MGHKFLENLIEILAPAWRDLEEITEYHLLMVGQISAKKITDRIRKAIEVIIYIITMYLSRAQLICGV